MWDLFWVTLSHWIVYHEVFWVSFSTGFKLGKSKLEWGWEKERESASCNFGIFSMCQDYARHFLHSGLGGSIQFLIPILQILTAEDHTTSYWCNQTLNSCLFGTEVCVLSRVLLNRYFHSITDCWYLLGSLEEQFRRVISSLE